MSVLVINDATCLLGYGDHDLIMMPPTRWSELAQLCTSAMKYAERLLEDEVAVLGHLLME
jgi:hypothetical protein